MTLEMDDFAVKGLDDPDDTVEFDNGKLEVVTVGDWAVKRATVEPDWRWSTDVAPLVGTATGVNPSIRSTSSRGDWESNATTEPKRTVGRAT